MRSVRRVTNDPTEIPSGGNRPPEELGPARKTTGKTTLIFSTTGSVLCPFIGERGRNPFTIPFGKAIPLLPTKVNDPCDFAAEVGEQTAEPVARRLAAIIRRQYGWLGASREKNHLWQLLWTLACQPLESAGRVPDPAEFRALRERAEERLRGELEPVPGWARNGIHTGGRDPRFAGSWEGLRNMIAMYQRDGVLDPSRPGVLLHEGQRIRRWRR